MPIRTLPLPTAPRAVASLLATSIAATWLAACQTTSNSVPAAPPLPPDTWATVDGRAITKSDVETAMKRTRDTSQTLSDEENTAARLSLLNDLIVQDVLLAKAAALKVDVPAADLDAAYDNARKNVGDEAYQKELTARGLTAAEMREGLRREMISQKLIDQEVAAKVSVSDTEITSFFAANRAQFNIPEESYRIAQIVVTPVREPQVTNATGDDAATPEAALAKTQMLMERLKGGAAFAELAAGYSEDAESAQRGGDLGLVPVSRLRQAPAQLRNAVLNKAPGSVNVASDGGAHTLILVAGHELAGQRDLNTPGVREQITSALRGRKEQLLRAAYLTAAQTDANVVNYLARQVVTSMTQVVPGAAPSVAPSAPGASSTSGSGAPAAPAPSATASPAAPK